MPYIYIDAACAVPAIINNWSSPRTLEAWDFITDVCNSVNYGASHEVSPGFQPEHMGLYEGTTLMASTMYPQIYRDTEYSKRVQINWVPYPKSTNEGGQEICQYYGISMMLPKKTRNEDNVNIALKFMELWATRFTESLFDNLNIFEYYNFNYKQRKQYFDFVTKNVVFGISMNDFEGSSVTTDTHFYECFDGSGLYDIRTEAAKASQYVMNYIMESLLYGR